MFCCARALPASIFASCSNVRSASRGRPRDHVGVAERDQRVRVVAGKRLEQFDRPAGLPGLRQVLAELDPHLTLRDAVLQRQLERRDRQPRAAGPPVDQRELAIGVLGVRAFRDHALVQADRVVDAPGGERLGAARQRLLKFDQPLRVVVFGVGIARRRDAAADIAERSQPVDRLRDSSRGLPGAAMLKFFSVLKRTSARGRDEAARLRASLGSLARS